MKWVTRERPKIDRLACPWLIRRFIDQDAEIRYVPAAEVLAVAESEGAIPFDVPGVELTHSGPLCSFDAFLEKYHLEEPALAHLAEIVRAADTDTLDRSAQAPGLLAISRGFGSQHRKSPGATEDGPAQLRRAIYLVPHAQRTTSPLAPADDPQRDGPA